MEFILIYHPPGLVGEKWAFNPLRSRLVFALYINQFVIAREKLTVTY